jgi:hypothetical protein
MSSCSRPIYDFACEQTISPTTFSKPARPSQFSRGLKARFNIAKNIAPLYARRVQIKGQRFFTESSKERQRTGPKLIIFTIFQTNRLQLGEVKSSRLKHSSGKPNMNGGASEKMLSCLRFA